MDKPGDDQDVKVKEKGKLIETLKFFGAISGLLALLGSAGTFIALNSFNIYKQHAWEEKIKVLKCNTMEGYLISNIGDGEVYLNDVTFENNDTQKINIIYVRKIVKPKEFMEFVSNRKEMEGFKPALADHKDWPNIFAAINHNHEALSMEYLLQSDTMLKVIKQSAHEKPDNLITSNNGTATFNFYGARNGKNQLKIPVVGIVWKKGDIKEIDLK